MSAYFAMVTVILAFSIGLLLVPPISHDLPSANARCPNGTHKSPSGDCEKVTNTKGLPRCPNGYHRSPDGDCEKVSNGSSSDSKKKDRNDDTNNKKKSVSTKKKGSENTDSSQKSTEDNTQTLPAPTLREGTEISGPITYVVDGDTLDVNNIRIRLALVNTPEVGQAGFNSAKEFVEDRCLNKKGEVDIDDGQRQGSFGREIGVVFCDGTNINEALMNNSMATISTEFCDVSEFSDEIWAKSYCSTSPMTKKQTNVLSPIVSEPSTSAEEASTSITETEQEANNGNDNVNEDDSNVNSDSLPKKFQVQVILDNVTTAESDEFMMRVIVYGKDNGKVLNKPTLDKPGQLVNVQGCGSSCYTDWGFTASKVPIGSEIQACVWNSETEHQNCGHGQSHSQYGPEIIHVNLPSVS